MVEIVDDWSDDFDEFVVGEIGFVKLNGEFGVNEVVVYVVDY